MLKVLRDQYKGLRGLKVRQDLQVLKALQVIQQELKDHQGDKVLKGLKVLLVQQQELKEP